MRQETETVVVRQKVTRRHVTLLDVARASGFAVSTVSIVLNEAPLSRYVAAETREQIRSAARELGYHPDAFARSLRRMRSNTVGIIVSDLSDPFCTPILRGIENGLQETGYLPVLMDARNQGSLFERYLELLLQQRAEGLVVVASWMFSPLKVLPDIGKNQVPILVVGRDLVNWNVGSILIDNDAGGYLAMQHLYDTGHRRIAVLRGPEEIFDSGPRWAGVQRFAAENGNRLDEGCVRELPALVDPASGFENGVQLTRDLIQSGRPFTGLLAFDDLTALGAMRALRDAGRRVPEDCSVIGFDDISFAAISNPALTTIRQPMQEMGVIAAREVMQAIQIRERGEKPPAHLHLMPPTLVVRESVTAPEIR